MSEKCDKHVVVTEVVWKALIVLEDDGHYRSIDEAIRPVMGIEPGARPHLKGFEPNVASAC